MIEVKGVGRRTQIFNDLRNRRYLELKEEAEDRKKMETTVYHTNMRKKCYLAQVHGPAMKQDTS